MGILFVLGHTACTRRPLLPSLPPEETSIPASEAGSGKKLDAAVPQPELELRVEPSAIQKGDSALLTWQARYANSVIIDHNIGTVDAWGRIKFFPDETTTYRVAAEGPGGTVEKTARVEVFSDEQAPLWADDLRKKPLEEQFNYFVKPVFFKFDKAELTQEAKLTLDGNMDWLKRVENTGFQFFIEGHCDRRSTEEHNLALGDKRAQVVKEYMVASGVDPRRILTISIGGERPFNMRETEEAWALNRRAHFILIREGEDSTAGD